MSAGLLYLLVGLLGRGVNLGAAYAGLNLGWTATNRLRTDLAAHLLRLDMPFHKAHTPGELIERIDGDVSQLSTFFSQLMIRLIGNLLLLVAHGLPMAVTGQPFSLLFGLLSLAMALRLRQYLRSEPGQALGASERRRMSVAVRAGIGLALGQFVLNVCLTALALLGPSQ